MLSELRMKDMPVNLWSFFPEFILRIDGILFLPYLAIPFYLYVFYAIGKHAGERVKLMVFVLFTLLASGVMFLNIGPNIGKIIPPLGLLMVMAMPLLVLMMNLYNKAYAEARVWFLVSLAGWMHSISWSVWLFALARS